MRCILQSFNPQDLKYLGRNHSPEVIFLLFPTKCGLLGGHPCVDGGESVGKEARRAIELGKEIFPRMSFDLIYARHRGQTVDEWQKELKV